MMGMMSAKTILLVEDDPALRLLTARALRAHGYRFVTAEEAAAAVVRARRRADLLRCQQ